ncbi:dipeptide ABC transporter ATP-binding protein [Nocardia sp. NPDC057227]|uniref:dipeptide ABC transporter ATP-binding protein n=1 Tax=Nocardia sp. NPDC057227 TaxID=3346056 RepID=UPI00363F6D96
MSAPGTTSAPPTTAPATEPLVRVRDLAVAFGGQRVVDGLSFELRPGRCHALVGESGSGKSVTARSLLGLAGEHAEITAEVLSFDGRDLRAFRPADWRRLRGGNIGTVLQDALVSLDPLRTIRQEVTEALHPATRLRRARRDDTAVLGLLAAAGIPEPETRLDQYSHELSGGLRQRALIATAVARDPEVIIADEPTTALDATVQRQLLDLLRGKVAAGAALLLISHDLSLVAEIADTVTVLHRGVAVEEGEPGAVFANPVHPYTRRLLRAVPTAEARGFRLSAPEGAEEGAARQPAPARRIEDRIVLRAKGIGKSFRGRSGHTRHALHDVDLVVRAGETLGVVGESGSGKTTLMRIVLGLLTPDTGTVELHGKPWNPLPERARRPDRHRVQFVSQDPLSSFDPRYPVARLLADGIAVSRRPPAERHTVPGLLAAVGLDPALAARRPAHLSGGQRQRVAIARALAADPEILICDEPVSALDVSVQAQVLDLIAELQHRFGTSVLFVSHDLGVVHHVSDRVLVLERGAAVETGDVTEVYRAPRHPYTRALLDAVPRIAAATRGER